MKTLLPRPDKIIDESHARAIIRNWINCKEEECAKYCNNVADTFGDSTNRRAVYDKYKKMKNLLGDLLFRETPKIKHGKIPRHLELVYTTYAIRINDKGTRLVPINYYLIDTKKLSMVDYSDMVWLISEHALARILMRTNSQDITKVFSHLAIFIQALLYGTLNHTQAHLSDFILISRDAYVPVSVDSVYEGDFYTMKTWIGKEYWTRATREKLKPHLDKLSDKNPVMSFLGTI